MSVYSKQRKDGSKAWFYDFSINGVRYRGVGGTTKTQAIRAMEKKRSQVLDEGHGLVTKINNPKIELFKKKYLERRKYLRSHDRDTLSTENLLKFFCGKNLASISASNIEDYISYRMNIGVSNATINRELSCLKRMFNLAIKWGDSRNNPVKDVDMLEEPPGRTRFLSIEEGRKLINCASEHIKPIIVTALNTGMRLKEILTLKWNQVHIENVMEPSIELLQTKNNKKRFIPLNDTMLELLEKLMDSGKDEEYVFIGTRGEPLQSVKRPFKRALSLAGIKDFRFHDLRHTFASHYVMNGGDLLSLRDILGHQDLKMVERYSHLASAYKRRMINKLSGKFSICHPIATSGKIIKFDENKKNHKSLITMDLDKYPRQDSNL